MMKTSSTASASERCSRRSEEHTSELQSQSNLVCRLLLEKKKNTERKQRHRRGQTLLLTRVHVYLIPSPRLTHAAQHHPAASRSRDPCALSLVSLAPSVRP